MFNPLDRMTRKRDLLNEDGSPRLYKAPMLKAYCSYKACEDTTVYPYVWPGGKCPKCGKPLSWSGYEDVKVELDGRDERGRKRFRTEKRLRAPLGKVAREKATPA